MQGVWINVGDGARRPATKKELREAVAADPSKVALEATAVSGREPEGIITRPDTWQGTKFTAMVVGPDPYRKRSWYATLKVTFGRSGFKATVT